MQDADAPFWVLTLGSMTMIFAAPMHDSHVGAQVRRSRIRLGLSQTALAHALNVTRDQFAAFEHGTASIGGRQLIGLSILLGKPVRELLAGTADVYDGGSQGKVSV
jgi:transcriptional regulator with XRE-family HTH domain